MLWAGCKATLYLDEMTSCVSMDGEGVRCWAGQPWQQSLPEMADYLRSQRCKQVQVWLSGGLARPFLVSTVEGLNRWSEVKAMAVGMAAAETQLEGDLHVWQGRWQSNQPMLAVACALSLVSALHDLKASHGLRMTGIAPAWQWVAGQDEQQATMLLVHEDSATTLLQVNESGVWQSVATYAPKVPADQMHAWVVRQAFTRGVSSQHISQVHLSAKEMTLTDAYLPARKAPPLRVEWSQHAH